MMLIYRGYSFNPQAARSEANPLHELFSGVGVVDLFIKQTQQMNI